MLLNEFKGLKRGVAEAHFGKSLLLPRLAL